MKGILFTEPLFHKVVSGEKTQTRRIMKPQPIDTITKENKILYILYKPRYKPGETLYLKEPEKPTSHFIKITGVRAERLQDITDSDCVKEGITVDPAYDSDVRDEKILIASSHYIAAYADLIDKINGKGTWERNPFVWVYNFRLTDK